jgi:hypothetical protein
MDTMPTHPHVVQGVHRRTMLKAALATGVTLSTWSLPLSAVWGAEDGQPKRGGILRVRGFDPPHFDPHLTSNFRTNATLSFVHSTLPDSPGFSGKISTY